MTIYNRDGLRADLEDEAVSIYIEGKHCATVTQEEFLDIALAITGYAGATDRDYEV